MDDKTLIEEALGKAMLVPKEWRDGEDGIEAVLGRWSVIEEDEDRGLYEGDEGVLSASVVGAEEYGNRRVSFYFVGDGLSGGEEVRPFDDVEPA